MKKRVCAVPFSAEDIPVILNAKTLLDGYAVHTVVTPKGIGIDGRDIGHIENRAPLGFTASSDMETGIQQCEATLILGRVFQDPLYVFAVKALEYAITQKKIIFCLLRLSEEEKEKYAKAAMEHGASLWFARQDALPPDVYVETSEMLYKPHANVVFIGELVEKTQGYEVFCNLLSACKRAGLKATGISAEPATALFGHHMIDLSQMEGNPAGHVFRVNQYIRELEKQEHPELILIHLSKPMMRFDERVLYDLGVSAYMISQAVTPGYMIICSPFGFFEDAFWKPISESFEVKFG